MFNFHNALTAFHNEKVTLPLSLRTEMKKRRNSNRTRLDKGLKENKKPLPFKKVTQGSYVMKTMIRDADNDYDIDDGIYFKKSQLKTQLGTDMSALDVRKMICKILSEDNRFKDRAEVRNHCVRVNYNSGYHVDIPIYKTDEDGSNPQLASSKWMPSNAEDVSSWFDEQNQSNSPDKENGRQLRRTVRLLKKFAKSRDSWKRELPSGFALTILVCEQFHPCLGRDDISLHKTMHKIYQRLCGDLEIRHPITCSALVNSGSEDAKTKNLRNRISENLNNLQLEDCSKEKIATAWNTVFNTNFFVEYVSRSTLTTFPKVVKTVVDTSRKNHVSLLPPHLWDGKAGVETIRQHGANVLLQLPHNLPHVVQPRWSKGTNCQITVSATLTFEGNTVQTSCGAILPKGANLEFSCKLCSGMPISTDFIVKWQVVNTCFEAGESDCLRGGFESSSEHAKRKEETKYCGIHWVEAFLIRTRDKSLCGRSGRFFVVIDD